MPGEELRECQRCGGTPDIYESTNYDCMAYGIYHVCPTGDSTHIRARLTKQEAIAAWNHRYEPER